VNSEEEFLEVKQKAVESGMIVSAVLDAGKTEFNGVPTLTALSIGPARVEEFSDITSHLSLL
jgi:PTH2 family peptidyl-tRNA hydrolase